MVLHKGIILLLRILIFTIISTLLISFVYLFTGNPWTNTITTDTWNQYNCSTIDFTRSAPTHWISILKNSNYDIIKITPTISYSNTTQLQTFTYYQNIFYMLVPETVVRVFTFNIIHPSYYNIIITGECGQDISTIIKMYKEVDLQGYISINNISTSTSYSEYDTDQLAWKDSTFSIYNIQTSSTNDNSVFESYVIAFFTLNGFLLSILFTYSLYYTILILYKEWKSNVQYWEQTYFFSYTTDFQKHHVYVLEPLFLIDNLFGNKDINNTNYSNAVLTTLIYTGFVWCLNIMFVVLGFLLNNKTATICIFSYLVFFYTFELVHLLFYYLDMPYKYSKYLITIMYTLYSLSLACSWIYFLNIMLWFFIGILVKPSICAAVIIIFASIIMYLIKIPTEYTKIKCTLEAEFNLDNREVVLAMIYGFVILIFLTIWIFVAWYIYNIYSNISNFITSLMVPLVAFLTGIQQLSTIEKQIATSNTNNTNNTNSTNSTNTNLETTKKSLTADKPANPTNTPNETAELIFDAKEIEIV